MKKFITYLFFKYCYKESELATYMMCYYVPNTMKQLKKEGVKNIDGKFLFAQIETNINNQYINLKPICDVSVSQRQDGYKILEVECEN